MKCRINKHESDKGLKRVNKNTWISMGGENSKMQNS